MSFDTKLFSVIVPITARHKLLVESLQSIINQTNRDYELILVFNSNSTSLEGVNLGNHQSSTLKLVPGNGTLSNLYKIGIDSSSGEFITFLTPGNLWEPHFLEELGSLIREYPESNLYSTGYQFQDENGNYSDPKIHIESHCGPVLIDNYFSRVVKGDQPFVLSSFCIRRSWLISRCLAFSADSHKLYEQHVFVSVLKQEDVIFSPMVSVFSRPEKDQKSIIGETYFYLNLYNSVDETTQDKALKENIQDYAAKSLLSIIEQYIQLRVFNAAANLLEGDHCKRFYGSYLRLKWQLYFRRLVTAVN